MTTTDPHHALIASIVSADELADGLGVSRRRVRADARLIGACIVVGKRVMLTPADVAALLKHWRPEPKAAARTGAPARGTYADLLRLRKTTRGGELEELRAALAKGDK